MSSIPFVAQLTGWQSLGKIKLGEKLSEGCKATPNFITKAAPQVEKVYGKTPTSFLIVPLHDKFEDFAPSWFQWYGGSVLQCKSFGDGTRAYRYKDRKIGDAAAPIIRCPGGPDCPDWAPGGKKQCAAKMGLRFWLPKVAVGAFDIYFGNRTSMRNMALEYNTILASEGRFRGVPLYLHLVKEKAKFRDPKSGKSRERDAYNLHLEIAQLNPEEMAYINKVLGTGLTAPVMEEPADSEILDIAPEDMAYPEEENKEPTPLEITENLIKTDPEVIAALEEFYAKTGKEKNHKNSLMLARRTEGYPDQKKELLEYLKVLIVKHSPSNGL